MNKYSVLVAVVFGLLTLSACNTISGMGKDIKAGGAAVENTAEKAKK